MKLNLEISGPNLMKFWNQMQKVSGGRYIFSKILSKAVPYTGTLSPYICELRPGYARVQLKDHQTVRNHLKSIHAAALMNIAEAASGLAFNSLLNAKTQSILVGFDIQYFKKARGTLYAACDCQYLNPKDLEQEATHQIESKVYNVEGDVVCLAKASWRTRIK
jgi:acyl-coenzyme A thioesterase PaaI-like protein